MASSYEEVGAQHRLLMRRNQKRDPYKKEYFRETDLREITQSVHPDTYHSIITGQGWNVVCREPAKDEYSQGEFWGSLGSFTGLKSWRKRMQGSNISNTEAQGYPTDAIVVAWNGIASDQTFAHLPSEVGEEKKYPKKSFLKSGVLWPDPEMMDVIVETVVPPEIHAETSSTFAQYKVTVGNSTVNVHYWAFDGWNGNKPLTKKSTISALQLLQRIQSEREGLGGSMIEERHYDSSGDSIVGTMLCLKDMMAAFPKVGEKLLTADTRFEIETALEIVFGSELAAPLTSWKVNLELYGDDKDDLAHLSNEQFMRDPLFITADNLQGQKSYMIEDEELYTFLHQVRYAFELVSWDD